MEDNFQIKEIKVMDGVYIWKPESKTKPEDSQNNKNKDESISSNKTMKNKKEFIGENSYICNGKDELIKIYEIEFNELGETVQSLFQSNEEMLEFDPHDYDLIQAREENLQIIDRKIDEMMKIQIKMKEICENHPIINVNIFDHLGIGKNTKNENTKNEKKIENDENLIKVDDQDKIYENNSLVQNKENNSNDKTQKDKTQMDNNMITEIEL